MASAPGASTKRLAWEIIIVFGVVSLVADVMYEGARSVNGPYLKTLGASATAVGFVAGLGELLGYAARLLSGWFADRTKAYWVFVLSGYGLLATVPLLAFAGAWQFAALLIVLERFGKAIRSPSKDTILSAATRQVGTGIGFGLHEAMDQLGALLGPLVFTLVFALSPAGGELMAYQRGYAWLWIPFAILALSLGLAFLSVPDPERLEPPAPKKWESERLSKTFWLYTLFTFATTLGFVAWPILSFHYASLGLLSGAEIALFYAVAMGVDGLIALAVGWIYDRLKGRSGHEEGGLLLLLVIPLLSLPIPLLGFGTTTKTTALVAAVLFGLVMGTHETIMKSAIADITPMKKRGTGYGVFNTVYGLAFFASSVSMGFLYDADRQLLVVVALAAEALALPVFFLLMRESRRAATRSMTETTVPLDSPDENA